MPVECFPSQADEVVAALQAALAAPAQGTDPWWQAGLESSLAGGYGETACLPRSTLGADRA
jgi:hypothetical protein